MSLQVHVFRSVNSPSASATQYLAALNGQYWDATAFRGTAICTAAGTFSNWSIVLPSAPGTSKSLTFTLMVNGVASAAVIAISGTATSGTYTATTIALADGDELAIRSVPAGTPTVSTPSLCWDFNGTTAAESIYGSGNTKGGIGSTRTNAVFSTLDVANWAGATGSPVAACAGTITKVTIKIDLDVTGTGSMTFTLVKNGTAQNGTGGTPDTRIAFATGTLKASATFSLAVAAGDVLIWQAVPAGTAPAIRPITGVRFVATTAGQSHFAAPGIVSLASGSATVYAYPGQGRDGAFDATESNRAVTLGLTGFRLTDLRATISTTPTGGSVTYNLRKNSGSGSNSVTITPTATAGSNTSATTYAPGDTLAMELVTVTAPASRVPCWALTQDQGTAAVPRVQPFIWMPL